MVFTSPSKEYGELNNELWEKLLKIETLKRGWHLARKDATKSFIEDMYCIDAYASDLDNNLLEMKRLLNEGRYKPSPLTHIDIPKSSLAARPGSAMQVEDRILGHAIVYLIAPLIDPKFYPNVYSYRLKPDFKKSDELFEESDALDIPYLKGKFINKHIDPFEAWYSNWPKFDEKSKESFLKNDHNFMAVSDISAYFENIQIPILRDQLLSLLVDEGKIVNLLISFLEAWAVKTSDGRSQWRGIPQGNSVSSFLGNLFLMPVDAAFKDFCEKNDAEYFRYMDDVRIFTKKETDARKAILLLDQSLKSRHLNVQSAKTKILREKDNNEISHALIDDRLDDVNGIIDEIKKSDLDKTEKKIFLKKLNVLARRASNRDTEKIIPKRNAFKDGLDIRFFRRWATAHLLLGSNAYIDRLLFEIESNPDPRMTTLAMRTIKHFPRQNAFALQLLKFIRSELNLFPQQEAELIRAFRYLSEIPEKIIEHCRDRAFDSKAHFYVRMQSFHLLSRAELSLDEYKQLNEMFPTEMHEDVQASMAGNLVKFKSRHGEILKMLVFHPNDKVRKIGKYFRQIKWDRATSYAKHRFLFKSDDTSSLLCDNMPVLYLLSYMKMQDQQDLKKKIIVSLKSLRMKAAHKGHRPILEKIYSEMLSSTPGMSADNDNLQPDLFDGIIEASTADALKKAMGGDEEF